MNLISYFSLPAHFVPPLVIIPSILLILGDLFMPKDEDDV